MNTATVHLMGHELTITVPEGVSAGDALITHLRACLGEGMCPFAHPVRRPDPAASAVFPEGELVGDCWTCTPPARWSIPRGANCYSWTRLTAPTEWPT